MRFEIPEVGRCCFCFPLRLGLIVWGYIKIAASLVLLVMLLLNFIFTMQRNSYYTRDVPYMLSNIIGIGSIVADIVFHIIFAVGAHKKDPKKMELFLKFCIYILVMYILGLCYALFFLFHGHIFAFLFGLMIGTLFFVSIVIQIYIMILIRSEVVKLKRGSNFQFVNHGAEVTTNVKIDIDPKMIH